ncbi:hypothetical protein LF1_19080 [Rubripirellula obstinata]|uniref:Uncharacterized protein n=1 Tax=Rubripirellula obstinata TaxID=406547 RepID=A0A5B1CFR3_9BACT|nr:hypothetical protein [Rubripirellula obstinata]KAA1259376.1 hypothetical protein LF1_19080 [Rubripirellula obstinata]
MPNRSLRLFPSPTSESRTSEQKISEQKTSESRRQRELDRISGVSQPKSVTIPLSTIVPLLIEASKSNRAWLSDFADDTVQVDSDLYEVLMAYQSMQISEAA